MAAPRDGVVTRLGALDVGIAALELGAGRRTKADPVDHAVGVLCFAKRGDTVLAGDDLAEVHARDDASAERALAAVLAAYEIGDEAPTERGILLDVGLDPLEVGVAESCVGRADRRSTDVSAQISPTWTRSASADADRGEATGARVDRRRPPAPARGIRASRGRGEPSRRKSHHGWPRWK